MVHTLLRLHRVVVTSPGIVDAWVPPAPGGRSCTLLSEEPARTGRTAMTCERFAVCDCRDIGPPPSTCTTVSVSCGDSACCWCTFLTPGLGALFFFFFFPCMTTTTTIITTTTTTATTTPTISGIKVASSIVPPDSRALENAPPFCSHSD